MNYLSNIKVRNKLILMLSPLVTAVLLLSSYELYERYRIWTEMKSMELLSTLAVEISSLVHELQKERAATVIFVEGKGLKFKSELLSQRSATDKKITELQAFLRAYDIKRFGAEFSADIYSALQNLGMIQEKRESASALQITGDAIIGYYNRTNASFLTLIAHISRLSARGEVSAMTTAYVNFLFEKEKTGVERAVLSDVFTEDRFESGMFERLISSVAAQEIYTGIFLSYATADQRDFYRSKMSGKVIEEAARMRRIAFEKSKEGKFGIEPSYWYEIMTSKINLLKDVEDKLAGDLEVVTGRLKRSAHSGMILLILLLSIVVLSSSALAYLITCCITRSLGEAVAAADCLANGDLTIEVKVRGADETGLLLSSMRNMITRLKTMVSQTSEASNQVFTTAHGIESSSANIQISAQTQFQAIGEVSSSVKEMDALIKGVAGDAETLTLSTESASVSTQEMFAMINETAEDMGKVARSVDVTASSISQIAAALKQVALYVNTLFKETKDIVSAADEMSYSIKEVSLLSREQAVMAGKVKEEAVASGMESVKRTRGGMEEIRDEVSATARVIEGLGKRSKGIGNIINVIAEVADTSNLLALNASILAARAGEQGKGFAVVAEEIKNLAERTKSSTREIEGLIRKVQGEVEAAAESMKLSLVKVEEGVHLSRNAEQALTEIVKSAGLSLDMAKEIERVTEAQTMGVTQAAEAVQRINLMVEDVQKATAEQDSAAEEISRSTEEIRGVVWKITNLMAEQSKRGRDINEVILDVAQKMYSVSLSTAEQEKAFRNIITAITIMKEETQKNVSLTGELDRMVSNLNIQDSLLKKNVEYFKV